MRYLTILTNTGSNQPHETYREADTPADAALDAIRAWRSDARLTGSYGEKTTRGTFQCYSFAGPVRHRDAATVRVLIPEPTFADTYRAPWTEAEEKEARHKWLNGI